MRIAIVIPEHLSGRSFLQPPLGIALCATHLRLDGHEVRLIDNRIENMSFGLLAARIKGADLVVIPTTLYDCMQNYWVDFRIQYAIKTINHIKRNLPDTTIVICGSHGTVRPHLILRDTLTDIVLLGEYEKTLRLLAKTIECERGLADVPNLIFRREDALVSTRYDESFFHPEVEDNVFPDYSDMDFGKYYHDDYINNQHVKGRRWGTILSSRGCPYNCLFCYNFFGKNVRLRSPESVADELEFLQNKLGLRGVFFIDSTFGLDRPWVFQLCEQIKRKSLTIPWNIQSRCDLLPLDLLKEMKSANCNRIWVGIESFDVNILRVIRKGCDVQTVEDFLEDARAVGLKIGAFVNFGLPGETLSSVNHTINKLRWWGLTYTKSIVIASPKFGTDYYKIAKKQYPYIGNNWSDINAISGLVGNEMKPHILRNIVNLMYERSFIYGKACPRITDRGIEYA